MIKLGIFAKTFRRNSFADILDAIVENDMNCIQFNMSCIGLPAMPDVITSLDTEHISQVCEEKQIIISAVSGTFNMIHPEVEIRNNGLQNLAILIKACPKIRTNLVSLCTGTGDPDDQWKPHPYNNTQAAWKDLVHSLEQALQLAEQLDVNLGVEPELANVVNSVEKARTLLDEMQSKHLKIILDPVNLFERVTLNQQHGLLDKAFDLLGNDIVMAHAKDRDASGVFVAAGHGVLDFKYYLCCLINNGFESPVVLHGLEESEVATSHSFLKRILEEI
ncbi:MAG: epimerase [Anaerolineaceae bacterium]|nr:epimerase [Anaerolineaceae bacterium]